MDPENIFSHYILHKKLDLIKIERGCFRNYISNIIIFRKVNIISNIICTDEEADELAYDYIVDNFWAFTPSFLAYETGLDIDVFEALAANDKWESNNDAIASLIKSTCGHQEFVDSAIGADGRGHFLAFYDHEEHEITVGDKTFYIYRVN